jgi:hypothetical protein
MPKTGGDSYKGPGDTFHGYSHLYIGIFCHIDLIVKGDKFVLQYWGKDNHCDQDEKITDKFFFSYLRKKVVIFFKVHTLSILLPENFFKVALSFAIFMFNPKSISKKINGSVLISPQSMDNTKIIIGSFIIRIDHAQRTET